MDWATAELVVDRDSPSNGHPPDGPNHRAPVPRPGDEAASAAPANGATRADVVVCSFHTDDEYYRGHARSLRAALEGLGVAHEIEEVVKAEGEDWADICRKKIAFLARVCEQNPAKKVFWIDVDCSLLSLPGYVADFSADIIGFQRGFSSPLTIGYARRTRFWEPCFFGISTTPSARKFIADAAGLESSATIKATDDYFFEESWRVNAPSLSFQLIPSTAVVSKGAALGSGVVPFFSFGASGSVAEFKDKVVQHAAVGASPRAARWRRLARHGLRGAKAIERRLPGSAARPLRKVADSTGLTHLLTGGDVGIADARTSAGSPHANRAVREMLAAGQAGDGPRVKALFDRLAATSIASPAEVAAKEAAETFAWYATRHPQKEAIRLAWWPRPYPGNFGDWLSPLVLSELSQRSVQYQSLTARGNQTHLVSIGSVGRFIKPASIVVGTGVSSDDVQLDNHAHYVSVRGPVTAQLVRDSGGPVVESMGDPGLLLSRLLPQERAETNGRVALVRHFKHATLPVVLPETMDELSVLAAHPSQVRELVSALCRYDAVVTSAMHVMIACHSYGIPCALVTFEGFESAVHGTGVKYRDYALGAGLDKVHDPTPVGADLRTLPLDALLSSVKVAEDKLDEVELAVTVGIGRYLDATT